MIGILLRMFGASLYLFPRSFRRAYGHEMVEIFADRISALPRLSACGATVLEVCDVAVAALRARVDHAPHVQPAVAGAIAIAIAASMITLHERTWQPTAVISAQSDSIDFNAQDPAGEFTLTIRQGRPIAASIDREPLPAARLVHRGDSIRFLAPSGGVLLTVAYHRESARIEWQARPESCRGQAANCEGYQ